MSSLSEGRIARLIRNPETLPRLRTHNQAQLTRIYPAGTRVMSNNMEAEDVAAAWGAGCHMIALNFQVRAPRGACLPSFPRFLVWPPRLPRPPHPLDPQTWDTAMQLNASLFSLNAACGYVLKPPPRPLPNVPLPGERLPLWPPEALDPPSRLRLVVLSGEKAPLAGQLLPAPPRKSEHVVAGRCVWPCPPCGSEPGPLW